MSETVVALVGGVLALVGLVLAWRQRRAAAAPDAIRLVSSRYLGGKRYLTIVEVDGERLLLGVTGDRVGLVTKLGGARRDDDLEDGEPA
ncbi:MAG: flagellar biosynthetic protein FliO [bacterium]|nr:flagellar biosynthetic protein FliO [bacterium]